MARSCSTKGASSTRLFQPDRNGAKYHSEFGDPGVFTRISGGRYELTEPSGLKIRFRANGTLESLTDTSGNQITTTFTSGALSRLTHSAGGFIDLTWNTSGRITSLTESTGQSTVFSYDPTNARLLSSTDELGTTSYTYLESTNVLTSGALSSVRRPNQVLERFEYDVSGRIVSTDLGSANDARQTFEYLPSGLVRMSNAGGGFDTAAYNSRGQLLRQELSDGSFVRFEYNDRSQLIRKTDSNGRSVSYTRCECGRPTSITDALGNKQLFTLGGPNNSPTRFKDSNGNVTRFEYDAAGNLTREIFADGSSNQYTYDATGTLDVARNRRGQSIDQTVNAAGQVTREVGTDGSWTNFAYTASGRLQSAETSAGFITLNYDTADRLTRVTYPNGRWIQYSYE